MWHDAIVPPGVLAVSPHLDDAVLSAGATLGALAAAGVPVVVCTVFAGDPAGPLTDAARRFHGECGLGTDPVGRRRDEDHAAAAALGLVVRHLSFPDAVYRRIGGRPLCWRPRALFRAEPADEPDLLSAVATALRAVLDQVRPALVLTCAGVGGHVDHRIVRSLVPDCARRRHVPIGLWADQPYTGRAPRPPCTPLRLPVDVTARHVVAKAAAAAAYRSQLALLWPGADPVTAMTRHGLDRLAAGEPAEPVQAAVPETVG